MVKQLPKRQRIRKGMVILAFLSFPVTMNFLSPYVIVDGAMNGMVNGSLVMFGLMFALLPVPWDGPGAAGYAPAAGYRRSSNRSTADQ